ncbi:hypothetical protein [Mesorhizobium amorphae]|uniref:hypothetical protein n=1 Tax=Mesorhizobium amorphae TaxID=71433 RepID=UPI000B628762|nr:hypothetical protein [Mesorhizobium amorphae]OWK20395.1 hypothetical protein AJ88_30270 [Mesorhizobium amorphae CCBAU 01583]
MPSATLTSSVTDHTDTRPWSSRFCAYLARLVVEHRLREDEAHVLAGELAYTFAKKAYRL